MDWTPIASFAIGFAGVATGAWQTHKASKVQMAGVQAQEHAAAFTAADSMIGNLHADNEQLRAEVRALRDDHAAEVAALHAAHAQLRERCDENDERNVATIRALHHQVSDMTKSIIGLRVLVVDEVAREAVRSELGDVDPAAARRMFRDLFGLEARPDSDRRRRRSYPPPGGERRRPADDHTPETDGP